MLENFWMKECLVAGIYKGGEWTCGFCAPYSTQLWYLMEIDKGSWVSEGIPGAELSNMYNMGHLPLWDQCPQSQ
jgi:hypothetical protein